MIQNWTNDCTSESAEMFEAEFDHSVSTVMNFNKKNSICVNDGANDALDPIYFENPFPLIINKNKINTLNRSTLKNLSMFYSHTNRGLN